MHQQAHGDFSATTRSDLAPIYRTPGAQVEHASSSRAALFEPSITDRGLNLLCWDQQNPRYAAAFRRQSREFGRTMTSVSLVSRSPGISTSCYV